MFRSNWMLAMVLLLVPLLAWGCAKQVDKPWKDAGGMEPEKTITLTMEGMDEEVAVQLHVSSLHPYAIYLDQERYGIEEKEHKDIVMFKTQAEIPEVFMAIWHREGVEIASQALEIERQLKEKYGNVIVHGWVESPLPAMHIYAGSGDAWDDAVERYYLIEDFKNGVFIVQQKMFKGAVEGHGLRFDAMLQEFYVWNSEKGEFLKKAG